MRDKIRSGVPVVAAAILGASLTAGVPAVASVVYDAVNADKVDGRHAVGAGATLNERKGKLVATNSSGRLPNNIIAKAPDSDRLGGLGADSFLRSSSGAVKSSNLAAGSVSETHIADGSLTGTDIQDGSLGRQELSYDSLRPAAYGLVRWDATLPMSSPTVGLTEDMIGTDPELPGQYCFHDLPFAPTTASAQSDPYFSSPSLVTVHLGMAGTCPAGTQITVRTWDATSAQYWPASFHINIW